MKCNISILGGGVARDLLKGLEGKPVEEVSNRGLPQADFSMRRAYRYSRGAWNGHTYVTRHEATGGLAAWAYAKGFEQSWSQFRWRRSFRIKPKDVGRAELLLNRWVTRIVREIGVERYRVQAVERLDKICEPYIKNEAFLAWIEKQEKVWGESDYSKLTVEDCDRWIDGVRQWAQANGQPFNVNPSGQAGVAWAM